MSALDAPKREMVQFRAIDGLRFLAALGVVLHHFAFQARSESLEALMGKNYLFVDFFFAISGFVIFHNYAGKIGGFADYVDFLKNRIARIYPLHIATLAAFVLLGATFWRGRTDIALINPSALVQNILLIHAWDTTSDTSYNFPSWSISAEWFVYLLFPIVAWIAARGGARALFCLSAICFLGLQSAVSVGWLEPWTTLTFHFGALRALPTFLFGAALAASLDSIPLRPRGFAPMWALFGASVLAMGMNVDDRLIVALLLATLVACVMAERSGARGLLTRPSIARIGDLSYAIYLIHPLMATFAINLVGRKWLAMGAGETPLWLTLLATLATIVVARFVFVWFERPSRRAIRALRVAPPAMGLKSLPNTRSRRW